MDATPLAVRVPGWFFGEQVPGRCGSLNNLVTQTYSPSAIPIVRVGLPTRQLVDSHGIRAFESLAPDARKLGNELLVLVDDEPANPSPASIPQIYFLFPLLGASASKPSGVP